MDPLGVKSNPCIEIKQLTSWQAGAKSLKNRNNSSSSVASLVGSDNNLNVSFTCSEEINRKLYLWKGDVTQLSVQALILPVYEILSASSKLSHQLVMSAGPRFLEDVKKLVDLRTSEVRVHYGHDLPSRYSVHTVEPRYNPKYKSAADNALHKCYRSSLQACVENDISTVAISPIHITRKSFPVLEGAHIALRTIRKCLELLSFKFDAVIIVIDSEIEETYQKLFPAYFPRTALEMEYGKKHLLPAMYNEWGEYIQPERAIRITNVNQNKEEHDHEADEEVIHENGKDSLTLKIDRNTIQRSFASMSGDHDRKRKLMLQNMTSDSLLLSQDRIYRRLLRLARTQDFLRFDATKALYVSGSDVNGNRVVSIIGRYIPSNELDLEKVMLYVIYTLDSVVDFPYMIVFFNTMTTESNHFSSDFLRKLYNTLDHRYKVNLARLCIVHTTVWKKITTWFFTAFTASDIKSRILSVRCIPHLYSIVRPDQIDIPAFVLSYDMEVNSKMYKPITPKNSVRHSANFSLNPYSTAETSGAL